MNDDINKNIEIKIENDLWKESFEDIEKNIKKVFCYSIKKIDPGLNNYEVSILLSDNKRIQKLNKTYRKKDKPTNVLSFPSFDDVDLSGFRYLGDVVVAYETVKDEAFSQNKTFKNHTLHLIVHAALHLLGFDHIDDVDAEKMEKLEINILKDLEIKNPYEVDND